MARSLSTGLDVGAEFAGYRIEALIGRGGMGAVYLAQDTRLERKVALKLLTPALADDARFRARFLRESRLAASLDHPSVVPIYEAGEADGQLYIAMRYVDGTDLRSLLREGPLEPAEAIDVLAQVASALDVAHARGLVHRDVKPANILLADVPRHAYLADFGLSEHAASQASVESADGFTGTVDYVAPEQIRGQGVDGRADVYSLGCVLYECLVGAPPFRREGDLAVLWAHIDQEAPLVSEARPDLPEQLDAVVGRALAKDPAERFESCEALVAAAALSLGEWARARAMRRLGDAAARALVGRSDLHAAEAELAENVADLQLFEERLRAYVRDVGASFEGTIACPFKGLASFDVADAAFFFGRERLIAELVARLVSTRLLGVVGPSGSGKSSIVRAGLVPAIAAEVLPGSERWRRIVLRPGERPLRELSRVLGEQSLSVSLRSLDEGEKLFLVVDQFEEVFTACRDDEERAVFIRELVDAAWDPDGRAVLVLAIRADLYGRCAEYPELAELLASNVLVGPMQQQELRRAIELPARKVGLSVEPALTQALVDDMAGEPGALPLLSAALLELWMRQTGLTLTLESYRQTGGVQGAVARLAEDAYGSLSEPQQTLARGVLLRLSAIGEGNVAVRRRAPLAEFDLGAEEDVGRVIAVLTERRLLTVGDDTVEVAHEALLREWPRLRGWLEEDVQGRRLHRHLTESAREWGESGHEPAELYRGARLASALDWTADHDVELNELEREFIAQSRGASEAETRRQLRTNRRLRGLLIGVAILLAAAIAGGIFALLQRSQARSAAAAARTAARQARSSAAAASAQQRAAKSRLLAASSEAQLPVDPERSILLAMAAVRTAPTDQAVFALREALDRSPLRSRLMSVGQQGLYFGPGIAYSPDGKRLIEGSDDGIATVFDASDGAILRKIHSGADAATVAWTPDGTRIALLRGCGLSILDGSTYRPLLTKRTECSNPGYDFAFSADGSVLYYADFNRVFRWDLRTNRLRALNIGAFDTPWQVALSPDGRRLAVAGLSGVILVNPSTGRVLARSNTVRVENGRHRLSPVRNALWADFSPDGTVLAVAESPAARLDGGAIVLLDGRTLAHRATIARLAGQAFTSIAYSPDGLRLAYGASDGTAGIYSLSGRKLFVSLAGHTAGISQVTFSADGRYLATSATDGTTLIWNVMESGQLPIRAGGIGENVHVHSPDLSDLAFPGSIVARFAPTAGGHVGRVIVDSWSRNGARSAPPLVLGSAGTTIVRLSRSGRLVLTVPASGVDAGLLRIWDVAARRVARTVLAPAFDGSSDPSLSSDGNQVAYGILGTVNGTMELLDVGSGVARSLGDTACNSHYHGSWVATDFSPDGSMLAATDDCGELELWNTITGRVVARHSFGDVTQLGPVRFSSDGQDVAVANTNNVGQVAIVDATTGEVVHTLTEHTRTVQDLAFSPDGTLLATVGLDGTARVWDPRSGRALRVVEFPDAVNDVAFSPDGRLLATLDAAGTIRVQDACTDCENPAALMAIAKSHVTRQLTASEERTFGIS